MALPRARVAALLMLALYALSNFTVALQSDVFSKSETSTSDAVSLSILNISSINDENGDCFNPPTPRRGLYPAKQEDCFDALKELLSLKYPFRPITFARRSDAAFQLPKVVRKRTCVISIDVINDDDADTFEPLLMYTTASEITLSCTRGAFPFGGRTTTGPKRVVDVLVFGRAWPLGDGGFRPIAPENAVVVAGERLTRRESSLLNETSLELIKLAVPKTAGQDKTLDLKAPELGIGLECYEPPLPRQRVWPIDVKDCESACEAMLADRQRNQRYTFSREAVATKFWFPLPATFRYKTCIIHLDMKDDGDRDTVRLSVVEATAWVLAHKCSGEEKPVEQYGGRATVGAGTKGLINVWVYGRLWPPPIGATNMTSLVSVHLPPVLDSE